MSKNPAAVNVSIGERLARLVFARRGNHSEVHLREPELALLLTGAAELGLMSGAAALGRLGGLAGKGKTSPAKAAAARANGAKGGRPRRVENERMDKAAR